MSFSNFKEKIKHHLKPILPYGVCESWDELNPNLYTAIHIYWLKFYGLWYYDFSSNNIYSWLQMIYTVIVLCLVCFLPGIGEVVYLLRRGENVGDIAEGLYLFLSEMYTYFKVAVFWLNKEKIMKLLKYLHCAEFQPTETEHEDILRSCMKSARNVMAYYSTICVGAVSVGIVMPLTESFAVLPTNVEYPMVDVYESPIYEIIYIHHIYYKPATCIIDGAMDTILAAFLVSVIAQIEILAFNLRNFIMLAERKLHKSAFPFKTEYKDYDLEKTRHITLILRDCVKHHCSIIKYVTLIEGAFSLASALQFMLSVMVLCLVGIQFLSIEDPMTHPLQIMWMAIYLTCMLTEIFILCWFGNELICKSYELGQASFDSPWTSVDAKTCILLIIFRERCQRPLSVTAGKIFTLSLNSYTVLINWAYKAFAVMRNAKTN